MTEDTTDMTDEKSAENAAEDIAMSAEDPAQSTEPDPLEKAQAEALEMKTRYLRSVADMENFRKRIAREKQDIIRSAASAVIESLLPVLDNMQLGLQAAEKHPEAKDVTIGFKMVDDQLKSALTEQGLEAIVPDGERFDPNLHECISQVASDQIEEDYVIQTVRSGYRLNDKLLRAANVIVSSGPAQTE